MTHLLAFALLMVIVSTFRGVIATIEEHDGPWCRTLCHWFGWDVEL